MVNNGQNVVNVVCDAPLEETLYSTSRFMALKIMKKNFQLNPITEFDQDHNEWLEKRPLQKGLAHDHAFQGPRKQGAKGALAPPPPPVILCVRKENRKRNRQSIIVSLHGIKILTRARNFLFFLILDNAHGNKTSNSLIALKSDR